MSSAPPGDPAPAGAGRLAAADLAVAEFRGTPRGVAGRVASDAGPASAADSAPVPLPRAAWRELAAAHRDRIEDLVGPYLRRRAAGAKHPVLDFLFTYYGHKPGRLRRWHPGFGTALADSPEYAEVRGYHELAPGTHTAAPAFLARRSDTVRFVADLLRATAARPPRLSCFGLHEWAMVYRTDEVRHDVPLRLGRTGTDRVVETLDLRCTHYDAYRFFTPDAVGRNERPLTREQQVAREQPGCLHAGMDLYKWAFKLTPLLPSTLLLDCFQLACTARELDMRASPYDLSSYGYTPVPIETPSGRADYVRAQSDLARRALPLRHTLLQHCERLLTIR